MQYFALQYILQNDYIKKNINNFTNHKVQQNYEFGVNILIEGILPLKIKMYNQLNAKASLEQANIGHRNK